MLSRVLCSKRKILGIGFTAYRFERDSDPIYKNRTQNDMLPGCRVDVLEVEEGQMDAVRGGVVPLL